MPTLDIQILPVLEDNYVYLVSRDAEALVVDPADADAVLRELRERDLTLTHILVTHHHADHTGGVHALKHRTRCTVWGPDDKRVGDVEYRLTDGESFEALGETWTAMLVPGHTRTHLAFHCPEESLVFTGDALFAGGCGRLLECDAEVMWQSLRRIADLPDSTRVYCGHEYTEENYRFARTVSPNEAIYARRLEEVRTLLASGRPSVPTTIAQERESNVFLRAGNAENFAGLRRLKDSF